MFEIFKSWLKNFFGLPCHHWLLVLLFHLRPPLSILWQVPSPSALGLQTLGFLRTYPQLSLFTPLLPTSLASKVTWTHWIQKFISSLSYELMWAYTTLFNICFCIKLRRSKTELKLIPSLTLTSFSISWLRKWLYYLSGSHLWQSLLHPPSTLFYSPSTVPSITKSVKT